MVINSQTKLYIFTRDVHLELVGFGYIGHEFVLAFNLCREAKGFEIHKLEEPIHVFHYAERVINMKGKMVSLNKNYHLPLSLCL